MQPFTSNVAPLFTRIVWLVPVPATPVALRMPLLTRYVPVEVLSNVMDTSLLPFRTMVPLFTTLLGPLMLSISIVLPDVLPEVTSSGWLAVTRHPASPSPVNTYLPFATVRLAAEADTRRS